MRPSNQTQLFRYCLLSLFVIFLWPAPAAGLAWLSPEWKFRQPISVTNPTKRLLTDYQVRVVLRSTNIDFAACATNGHDVRITTVDGLTVLPHWIESWDQNHNSAAIWVKVPQIAATDTTTLFLYFGNAAAGAASSGLATFDFFEDFETAYGIGTGWTSKRSLPFERVADCAGAVYRDKLYVFGGYDRNAPASCDLIYSTQVAMYDPATDTWSRKTDMPTGRWGAVAVEYDGLIHVFAGKTQGSTRGTVHEIYDPATDTWTTKPLGPQRLGDQGGMGILLNHKIHLFLSHSHYEYDPSSDTYIERAPVPTPRKWATCATVNGLIYVIGGASPGFPGGYTNINEVYDPKTDTWTTKAPLPIARYGVTRENPVIDGKVYVTHGQSAGFFTEVYRYDPATDKWEKRSSGQYPRDGVACGVINGKLYVVGGRSTYDCVVGMNQLEEYDPARDRLAAPDPWLNDNRTLIRRDTSDKYEKNWSIMFDKVAKVGEIGIQIPLKQQTCAVDFWWKMTSSNSPGTKLSWGTASLGKHLSDGSLILRRAGGQAYFTWFDGIDSVLQEASLNIWYPVTMAWDGNTSMVRLGPRTYERLSTLAAPSRLYFGVNGQTRQYIDLVRVRRYVSPEPIITVSTSVPESYRK